MSWSFLAKVLAGVGFPILAAFGLWLAITRYGDARYHEGQLAEQVKAGKADLAALAANDRVEREQALITQRKDDDSKTAFEAGRADALRHVAGLRAAPPIYLPAATAPAAPAVGAGAPAELDDATACADGVVKAEQWRDWWLEQSEVAR